MDVTTVSRVPLRTLPLLLATMAAACSPSATAPAGDGPPPGQDVATPFPMDRGDDGAGTPGTYKGLWLRLIDNGEPAVSPVDGIIGVVCLGMSNANLECGALVQAVAGPWASQVDPAVRLVNCAVGGHAIERWIDPAFDDALWDACLTQKLAKAGVRPDQVRVVYHKAADQFGLGPDRTPLPPYPDPDADFFDFQANLSAFASRVREKLPSVQAVYTSSRSYGGFTDRPERGEPLSYEEGHALNGWLETHAEVDGAWYGWGAYLWAPACASGGENGAGVCYDRSDYQADGIHPSAAGQAKIATLVHRRLLEHAWYRR